MFLHQDSQQLKKQFEEKTDQIGNEFKRTKDAGKAKESEAEVKRIAKMANDANIYIEELQGTFFDMKIYEAFLEGAPPSILQLYIILTSCEIKPFQWFTLITSFLAFTYASSEIFLKCPTKAS